MSESATRGECFAVIFTSKRTEVDAEGYAATAARMVELAAEQQGFLGIESSRDADGVGITVSYWDSLEAIQRWRNHPEHLVAQRFGREKWYKWFHLRIARVEREFTFYSDQHGN